jgi:hypothetical protein
MDLTVMVSGERTITATVMRQVHSHLAALKQAAAVIPSPGIGFPVELQAILPAFELAQELAIAATTARGHPVANNFQFLALRLANAAQHVFALAKFLPGPWGWVPVPIDPWEQLWHSCRYYEPILGAGSGARLWSACSWLMNAPAAGNLQNTTWVAMKVSLGHLGLKVPAAKLNPRAAEFVPAAAAGSRGSAQPLGRWMSGSTSGGSTPRSGEATVVGTGPVVGKAAVVGN